MKVVIRTDSSKVIGSGHLTRCLTLAESFRNRGHEVWFISREHDGNLCDLIEEHRFGLFRLPSGSLVNPGVCDVNDYTSWLGVSIEKELDESRKAFFGLGPVDWLIVDHYALGQSWESAMRDLCGRILAIDDLANRPHDVDMILDQNLYPKMNERYRGLVPAGATQLLGPEYALLRDEFTQLKADVSSRTGEIKRVLVFFGGIDPTNETAKALDGLKPFERLTGDVVVGRNNPNRALIEERLISEGQFDYHCQVDNMAELMNNADLIIGAGGVTTWERCWLGKPSVVWSIAENQIPMSNYVAELGGSVYLGCHNDVTPKDVSSAVDDLLNSPDEVCRIARAAANLMGDRGSSGVERVMNAMMERTHAHA